MSATTGVLDADAAGGGLLGLVSAALGIAPPPPLTEADGPARIQERLYDAAWEGDQTTVLDALFLGGEPLRQNEAGNGPVQAAAAKGHARVLELLLRAAGGGSAGVHQRGKHGNTALHFACGSDALTEGHVAVVKLLLQHGADALARSDNGRTPHDMLRKRDSPASLEIAQCLDSQLVAMCPWLGGNGGDSGDSGGSGGSGGSGVGGGVAIESKTSGEPGGRASGGIDEEILFDPEALKRLLREEEEAMDLPPPAPAPTPAWLLPTPAEPAASEPPLPAKRGEEEEEEEEEKEQEVPPPADNINIAPLVAEKVSAAVDIDDDEDEDFTPAELFQAVRQGLGRPAGLNVMTLERWADALADLLDGPPPLVQDAWDPHEVETMLDEVEDALDVAKARDAAAAKFAAVAQAAQAAARSAAARTAAAAAAVHRAVMPPAAPITPQRSRRVVVIVGKDKERGFCVQFAPTLRVTAFRPRASGAPGPLETAGVEVGDRLVKIGEDEVSTTFGSSKGLSGALALLGEVGDDDRVELEFLREIKV